jgi:hypothetical protein
MLHICRDYLATHNTTQTTNAANNAAYLLACFLFGVLGFTQVGHTNFNLEATYTIGSGTNNANLKVVENKVIVELPVAYVVSLSDFNRIIALKSNINGKYNSGLFRIINVNTVENYVVLDPRQWIDFPDEELGLSWKIFVPEQNITFSFGLNTQPANSYRGWGNATTSRLILQSPHASGWQVRICTENSTDSATLSFNVPSTTAIPGFGGNASGDFSVKGEHLHAPLFYNSAPTSIQQLSGLTPGISNPRNVSGVPEPLRHYIWGDDETGSCFFLTRGYQASANNVKLMCSFGLVEDEITYDFQQPVHSLFAIGTNSFSNVTNEEAYTLRWRDNNQSGFAGQLRGIAMGLSNVPVTCIPNNWCFLDSCGPNLDATYNANATYNFLSQKTELLKWELIAGSLPNAYSPSIQPNNLLTEPRVMGNLPFARKGITNLAIWSTSIDQNRSWIHIERGLFLPWEGNIVP